MLETMSTQFDSFLFWRQPIPSLDLSELEDLGLAEPKLKVGFAGVKGFPRRLGSEEGDDELSPFNTFNYWREPIASIDSLDFSLLL